MIGLFFAVYFTKFPLNFQKKKILGVPVMRWAFLSIKWGITFKSITHHSSSLSQLISISSSFVSISAKSDKAWQKSEKHPFVPWLYEQFHEAKFTFIEHSEIFLKFLEYSRIFRNIFEFLMLPFGRESPVTKICFKWQGNHCKHQSYNNITTPYTSVSNIIFTYY